MNDEPDAPKRGGMSGLMLAHVVCCGGVLLFVTGALTLGRNGSDSDLHSSGRARCSVRLDDLAPHRFQFA